MPTACHNGPNAARACGFQTAPPLPEIRVLGQKFVAARKGGNRDLPFSQSQGNQEQYGLPSKKDGRKWEGFLANIRYALFVLPRHLLLSSRASVLAREIGKEILVGFPRRIRALCQSRLRVYYGTVRSENIDRLGNERTRACTRDTQDALRSHRWAMLLDHYFFALGWQSGAEWALREMGIPDSDRVRKSLVAWNGSKRSGNFMPLPTVQQSSKHDPSAPQPSLE
jgi:hypothetical protein